MMPAAAKLSRAKSLKRKVADAIDTDLPQSKPPKRLKDEDKTQTEEKEMPATTREETQPSVLVQPRASLMSIEPEVRLEILRYLLLLERNKVETQAPGQLSESQFMALARDPYALRNKYHPGQCTTLATDHFVQVGRQRRVQYRPNLQILQVCKQLKAEGEEVFYKENHYIGIRNPPILLSVRLQLLNVQYRQWERYSRRLMPHPVVQIDFTPAKAKSKPSQWLLLPPSELRRVGLALYDPCLFAYPVVGFLQRMHIRLFPGRRLLTVFRQQDFAGVKHLIQSNLVDWVGNEVQGSLEMGMQTPNGRDRAQGKASSPMFSLTPPPERTRQLIRLLRDDFKIAHSQHVTQGVGAAMEDYIVLRERIHPVAQNCHSLEDPSQVVAPTEEYHLLCMLSWILFHIASVSGPANWLILFAHRALTLPTYVAETEWKVRIHILVAGLLQPFARLRTLRVHHLMRAGSMLELAHDSVVNQQFYGFQVMATQKTTDGSGLEDLMVLLQAGLKAEMEKKYGVEVVIPRGALKDQITDATQE